MIIPRVTFGAKFVVQQIWVYTARDPILIFHVEKGDIRTRKLQLHNRARQAKLRALCLHWNNIDPTNNYKQLCIQLKFHSFYLKLMLHSPCKIIIHKILHKKEQMKSIAEKLLAEKNNGEMWQKALSQTNN